MKLLGLALPVVWMTWICAPGQSKTVTVPLAAGAAPGAAQKPVSVALAKAAPDYSAEPMVVERWDSVYRMAADGTGTRTLTLAAKIQSECGAEELGVVRIGFAGNSEQLEIEYVRVRRPDGTVVETPVSDAMEMPAPVTQAAPFYSDLKQKQCRCGACGWATRWSGRPR